MAESAVLRSYELSPAGEVSERHNSQLRNEMEIRFNAVNVLAKAGRLVDGWTQSNLCGKPQRRSSWGKVSRRLRSAF